MKSTFLAIGLFCFTSAVLAEGAGQQFEIEEGLWRVEDYTILRVGGATSFPEGWQEWPCTTPEDVGLNFMRSGDSSFYCAKRWPLYDCLETDDVTTLRGLDESCEIVHKDSSVDFFEKEARCEIEGGYRYLSTEVRMVGDVLESYERRIYEGDSIRDSRRVVSARAFRVRDCVPRFLLED